MSPTAAAVLSEKLLLNRHSCEGALVRKSNKANMDINHRSIHSDPGISFDFKQNNMDTGYIANQLLTKKRLSDMRSVVFRNDAGVADLQCGQTGSFYPMLKCHRSKLQWNKLDDFERLTGRDLRRSGVSDSQYSSQTGIISTSLSSSAASLYSDDDHLRSSFNASPVPSITSECPSVISRTTRHSISCIDEEAGELDENLNKLQQNIDNNNITEKNFAKVEHNHFNLNNNCQEDKSTSNVSLSSTATEKVGNAIESSSSSEEESENVSSLQEVSEVCALSPVLLATDVCLAFTLLHQK